jgi:hypothetical protein
MDSDSYVVIAPFDTLPEEALRVIMLALPVDARARAACVCPSWRAFLADPSLWQVLDLTSAGGVDEERVTANLVRGAVARAARQLRELSLNGWVPDLNVRELLVALVVSDGAALQQVITDVRFKVEELRVVLAAAPRLQVLSAQVVGGCTELLPVLRNDPPYGPLRVSALIASGGEGHDVLALAAAVATHESVSSLELRRVSSARGLNAVVDVAAERRVSSLHIASCEWDAESIAALARLLRCGSLTFFIFSCFDFPHGHEESLPVLSDALRACRTLTYLGLCLNPLYGATRHVTDLLDAAASLPALTELDLSWSTAQDTVAFGHALGALLRADLPSFHTLNVEYCRLGDEGMAAVLDGLAANTHLCRLYCDQNEISDAFRRDRLDPALAALEVRAALDE